MISGEVQAALIGVGSGSLFVFGRLGFEYLKLKLGKNGKNGYCSQHHEISATLKRMEAHFEEEKQIGLYMEAIRRSKNKAS